MKHPYSEIIKNITETVDDCKVYISLTKEGEVDSETKELTIDNYSINLSISSKSLKNLIENIKDKID